MYYAILAGIQLISIVVMLLMVREYQQTRRKGQKIVTIIESPDATMGKIPLGVAWLYIGIILILASLSILALP